MSEKEGVGIVAGSGIRLEELLDEIKETIPFSEFPELPAIGVEGHQGKFHVRERFRRSGASVLEVRPETGRTHQIRVHLAASGLPIVGDPSYGRADAGKRHPGEPRIERPALHAAVLGFEHPASSERMRFEAPWPADLAALLAWLRSANGSTPQ